MQTRTDTGTKVTALITMTTTKSGARSFVVAVKGFAPSAPAPSPLAAVRAFIAQNRLAADSDLD